MDERLRLFERLWFFVGNKIVGGQINPDREIGIAARRLDFRVKINRAVGRVARNYEWMGFRFLPDGSTDLPPTAMISGTTTGDTWYLTLVGSNDLSKDIKTINFYTVQIDPVSGTLKSYRPKAG